MAGSLLIDGKHALPFVRILRQVYGGPGRTVDDRIRFQTEQSLRNSGSICDIQRHIRSGDDRTSILDTAVGGSNVRTDTFVAAGIQFIDHVMAKLSGNAGHKYLHTPASPRFPYIFS